MAHSLHNEHSPSHSFNLNRYSSRERTLFIVHLFLPCGFGLLSFVNKLNLVILLISLTGRFKNSHNFNKYFSAMGRISFTWSESTEALIPVCLVIFTCLILFRIKYSFNFISIQKVIKTRRLFLQGKNDSYPPCLIFLRYH